MAVASIRFRVFLLACFSCVAFVANGEPAPSKAYRDVIRQQDVMVAARDAIAGVLDRRTLAEMRALSPGGELALMYDI